MIKKIFQQSLKLVLQVSLGLVVCLGLIACAPELGSQAWCDDLENKRKSDWTDAEAVNYGKYCLVQNREDE